MPQKDLKNSGLNTITNKCKVMIEGIIYQNTDLTQTKHTFENIPQVYTPYISNNTHTYNYTVLMVFNKNNIN